MSFHFATFSYLLLLGQLSSRGILLGVEAKSLHISTSSPEFNSSSSSTIATVTASDTELNNGTSGSTTTFSASTHPPTNNLTTFSSAGNDSLESMEIIESSSSSSVEMDGENKTVATGTLLVMEEDDNQQSFLLSSPIDHNSNINMTIENLLEMMDGGSGNGSIEGSTDTPSEMLGELGSGSGGESEDITLDASSGSGSGDDDDDGESSGFGSSIISAIEGMFHFTETNSTRNSTKSNNSTEPLWTTDPTGTEIQALMFA